MHHSAGLRFLTPSTPSSTAANLTTAETGTDLDTEGKTSVFFSSTFVFGIYLMLKIYSKNNPSTFYFVFLELNNQRAFVFLVVVVVLFWGCCSFLFRLYISERILSICFKKNLFLYCFCAHSET